MKKEQNKNPFLNIDKATTLFLDRDGVINKKLDNDYVKCWEEFQFLEGTLSAFSLLSSVFKTIVIVTNQQGIGKSLMTVEDLEQIHYKMLNEITKANGRIDGIYFAPELATDEANTRKPKPDLALMAKSDFPEIQFNNSIIVGDAASDMQFGRKLGMICVGIGSEAVDCDLAFSSLSAFTNSIINKQ